MVDIVFPGVGVKLRLTYCPPGIKFHNSHICEETTTAIMSALRTISPDASPKPLLTVIRTTGISKQRGDIPIAFIPLYHGFLSVPHKDKAIAEELLIKECTKPAEKRAVSGYLIVRPSLLTNGAFTHMSKIKVGIDSDPAIGYTISRNDVGLFVYETAINRYRGDISEHGTASITY